MYKHGEFEDSELEKCLEKRRRVNILILAPLEIFLYICDFLPAKQICNLTEVNKQIYGIIKKYKKVYTKSKFRYARDKIKKHIKFKKPWLHWDIYEKIRISCVLLQ